MKRSVIFLTDANEAPAAEWVDALTSAGISVVSAEYCGHRDTYESTVEPQALLFEVVQEAQSDTLKSVVDWVHKEWAELPIIGCRRQVKGHASTAKGLDDASLKRLGFRAIADVPAQLPTLLRLVEDVVPTGELRPQGGLEQEIHLDNFQLPNTIRSGRLRTAISLVAALHCATDQKHAGQLALSGIVRLIRADNWSLFLTQQTSEPDGVSLELLVTQSSASTLLSPSAKGASRNLLTERAAPVTSDVARLTASRMELLVAIENRQRIVAVPLLAQERVLGVLQGSRNRRSFSDQERHLLVALATPIAAALANSVRIADAERLSMTDDLTKLNNARYLRHFLVNEIKRARRYGSNVAALFIDLDDFKQVNDLHGHLVGSHVLMEVAAAILPSVRDTDCVIRYGGDEFVVILTETGLDEALQVADRIRQKIESRPFTGGRRLKISLTSSFGVAVFPQHALSPQQLITCADRAMYEAKAAGKNCVRVTSSFEEQFGDRFRNLNMSVDFQKIPDQKLVS